MQCFENAQNPKVDKAKRPQTLSAAALQHVCVAFKHPVYEKSHNRERGREEARVAYILDGIESHLLGTLAVQTRADCTPGRQPLSICQVHKFVLVPNFETLSSQSITKVRRQR